MSLTEKQKGVVRRVVPAAALTLAGLGGAPLSIPVDFLPLDAPGARIGWALPWALVPILALMIAIMRVANHRFFSPDDIDGSGLTAGTMRVNVLRAILQNTLEQSVLAVAAYVIWSAVMPLTWLRAIPPAALLFAAGRVLFTMGYDRGAAGRAMGFGLTAYPTFGMLVTTGGLLGYRLIIWLVGGL